MAGPSGASSRLALPYPIPDDTADVPRDVKALTDKLDPSMLVYGQGTAASRPAFGIPGRFYYATDTFELSYDTGSAWKSQGAGGDSIIAASSPVLDVGMAGQIRAGRQLTVADFTAMGLVQPVGLFNLSDLTNLGSGGALTNKGAVPFGVGINGAASSSAVFAGSTSQALYIADTGASDPFRLRTGSWGCWFRTAKRGVDQAMVSKHRISAGRAFLLRTDAANVLRCDVSIDGASTLVLLGVSDVCDDRWHFAAATSDGTALRLYLDGVLESVLAVSGSIFQSPAPLNIGGHDADSGTIATIPHYGRVDEAFITHDTLTEDQIRLLYCARLPHSLPATPTRVSLNVTRRRRGGAFATTDFPTQPKRLHNFTAGALTDQGSDNQTLTNNGTAVAVAGADGTPLGGFSFAGAQSLSATDAGLPAALTPRSYGCWFKTTSVAIGCIIGWGTIGTADARTIITNTPAGLIVPASGAESFNGPFVADGQWHFFAVVEDNAAGDGVRRKLYLDGRLVGGSTVLNTLTLAGANRFRIGAAPDGTQLFTGQIDGAFITSDALTASHVAALYAKGTEALAPSPKEEGAHVEALRAADVLCVFDTLQSVDQVDVAVSA